MDGLSFLLIYLGGLSLWLYRSRRQRLIARRARENERRANQRLYEWRLANLGIGIGESALAQELLRQNIAAWEELLRTHPSMKGKRHLEYLMALFHEKGPDPTPPPKTCPPPFRQQRTRAVSFYSSRKLSINRA